MSSKVTKKKLIFSHSEVQRSNDSKNVGFHFDVFQSDDKEIEFSHSDVWWSDDNKNVSFHLDVSQSDDSEIPSSHPDVCRSDHSDIGQHEDVHYSARRDTNDQTCQNR